MSSAKRKKVNISQLLADLDHPVLTGRYPARREYNQWNEGAVDALYHGIHQLDFDVPDWQEAYFNGEGLIFSNDPADDVRDGPVPWAVIAQLYGKEARLGLTVEYKGRRYLAPPCDWELGKRIGDFEHGDPRHLILLPLDMIDMEDVELS